MFNCSDLSCVLHHHKFYAHLHHLKRHLDGHPEDQGEFIINVLCISMLNELLKNCKMVINPIAVKACDGCSILANPKNLV